MIHNKIKCRYCGREFTLSNIARHEKACSNPNSKLNKDKIKYVYNEDLTCKYCGKQFNDAGNLVNHEIHFCSLNTSIDTEAYKQTRYDGVYDRLPQETKDKMKWNLGKTKETDERIARCSAKMKGRHIVRNYKYEEHNNEEINKWLKYIGTLHIELPTYEVKSQLEGYNIVSGCQTRDGNTINPMFEQNLIANILLDNRLQPTNCVHHIDSIRSHNEPTNLLIFIDGNNHKRFHNSDYAYLTYNEDTHLFSCELNK